MSDLKPIDAAAQKTGEDFQEIRRRGFVLTGPDDADLDPECMYPNCGGDIRLIAFKLSHQCETIPGLRSAGNLRLLRTSCPRAGADPENPRASWRTARVASTFTCSWPTHRLGRARADP